MPSLRLLLCASLLSGLVLVGPTVRAADHTVNDTNFVVPAGELAAKAIALTSAGSVVVRVTSTNTTAPLEVALVGPSGAQPAHSGTGSVSFTAQADAGAWSVRVTAPKLRVDLPVTIHVEYPGVELTRVQWKARADAKARVTASQTAAATKTTALPAVPAKFVPATASASVARGILAQKPPSALAANIGSAPLRVGALSAKAPAPPSSSNTGSGYSAPPATRVWGQINAIVINSPPPAGSATPIVHTCNGWTSCTFRRGDTLTIQGTKFNQVSTKTVSFFYFTGNREILQAAVNWTDTEVMVTVPDVAGIPNGDGAISLGASSDAVTSTPFGFKYQQVLTTDQIEFISSHYPAPAKVFDEGLSSDMFTVVSSQVGRGAPDYKSWKVAYNVWGDSISGTDTLLENVTLKNGWTVYAAGFVHTGDGGGSNAVLRTFHPGTSDASMQVHYVADSFGYVDYTVTLTIQGEPGTSYY